MIHDTCDIYDTMNSPARYQQSVSIKSIKLNTYNYIYIYIYI